MKSNNEYLKLILENFGGNVSDKRKPNNLYLREIAEATGSEQFTKHHSDNYYLKRIAENTKNSTVTLTGNKSIIQTNETATLTATYLDKTSTPVANKTIKLYTIE